jgi:quercetin dioxygenase-like cupin family protein
MSVTEHEKNEARVLHFRRDRAHDGVQVATVGLRRGESSLMHLHSSTRDTFYVMAGRLTVTVTVDRARGGPSYQTIGGAIEVHGRTGGGEVHKVRLIPGDVLVIEPRVVHCAANLDEDPCHFLCVEGVGLYDFVEVGPGGSKT